MKSIYILDWWLSPELYLRRPPSANERYRLDKLLHAAAERGVKVHIIVYKEVQAALTLNSAHTRKRLESLHPNIQVFRHPDHTPTGYSLNKTFSGLSLGGGNIAKTSVDALKALYGTNDGMVLFWAHHEKLCLIDERLVFMGGLDMCFGRWDTTYYNNARIYDFHNVDDWEKNKLDRTQSSRMGWTDVAISLNGPIVASLIHHFKDRWNYLYDQKYGHKNAGKYAKLETDPSGQPGHSDWSQSGHRLLDDMHGKFNRGLSHLTGHEDRSQRPPSRQGGGATNIQLVRSATAWSSGLPTEHSIASAYIEAITNAQHFVYIENQFFITATSDAQRPVFNKIGAAIVNRILKAHHANEEFLVIVIMPAVPGFAGDLKADGALGTRAIMEFQYFSISRGGHSIIETLKHNGIQDVSRYISFYNLRNYDRVNTSSTMTQAEQRSGVPYEAARKEHDDAVGAGYRHGEGTRGQAQYNQYQQAAAKVPDPTWDTKEIDAFVSEQLYIHSKLLIADDRLVICGSANINDRSQLGSHDSEIAVVIEDNHPVDSYMNGKPFQATAFAASLRRFIFRKHLGLIPEEKWDSPNVNWSSVEKGPNWYDWNSQADHLVRDPLHPEFRHLWNTTARVNTEVFSKVFHNVPNDHVRTWQDYDEFFSRHFVVPGAEAPKDQKQQQQQQAQAPGVEKVSYGHVVRSEFPGGVGEVKDWLSRVRGSLVEMPLDFLVDEADIAKEGLELNTLTAELYT
ncbi:unnamed protein product [Parascedosporium putredinis]|uniref:phospholipase D n=1 Tax=Parascedosporium putredinis TaxID=1442378 RepID=A0A9P1GUY4_9PEZI|nr:unnamed protein product [Parascedosporium putredinis]CAI7987816.1 unnamed protein product [Parascedosporium putredinis]